MKNVIQYSLLHEKAFLLHRNSPHVSYWDMWTRTSNKRNLYAFLDSNRIWTNCIIIFPYSAKTMTVLLKYKGQWRLFKGSDAIDQAKAFGRKLLKQGIHSIIYNHGNGFPLTNRVFPEGYRSVSRSKTEKYVSEGECYKFSCLAMA